MSHSTFSRIEIYLDVKLCILFDPDFVMWPSRPGGNTSKCQKSSCLDYGIITDLYVCASILFFSVQFNIFLFQRKAHYVEKFSYSPAVCN